MEGTKSITSRFQVSSMTEKLSIELDAQGEEVYFVVTEKISSNKEVSQNQKLRESLYYYCPTQRNIGLIFLKKLLRERGNFWLTPW